MLIFQGGKMLFFDESKLKIVIVKNFYSQIGKIPLLNHLFLEILKTKREGYLTKHSHHFLPVNTYDFIAYHVAFLDEANQQVVLTAKIVSYRDCLYYRLPFPVLDVGPLFNQVQKNEVMRIIDQRINLGLDVSYSGGWSVNPIYKGLGKSKNLRDLYTGIHYHVHKQFHLSTMMGFGAPQIGTLDFFKTWGVSPRAVSLKLG